MGKVVFRSLAGTILLAAACATSAGAATTWSFTQATDPITDQAVATAIAEYADGAWTRSVVVRCTGKKLETFVSFGEFLNTDTVSVQYRFDKDPAEKGGWAAGGGGTSIFADESHDAARRIATGTTLAVEALDFQGQPHRAIFDLTGANPSVSKVMAVCGVSANGLEASVPGLRKEVALDLERWGPKQIGTAKQILAALSAYSGPMDESVEPEFATTVQKFYDGYVADCRAGGSFAHTCRELHLYWDSGETHYAGAVSVIYEKAPSGLKKAFGSLYMGD